MIAMPKRLENRLKREARAKHFGKARANAYVYGTLRKLGWRPKKRRGKRKHA